MMRTSHKGFTLPEVIVTIAIYGLIMVGVSTVLVTLLQQQDIRRVALDSVDQTRTTGKSFTNEIRNAQTGNDGSYTLAQASTTQIIFFTSYGSPSANTIDRVRYFVSSSTLYKGVIIPTGSPLAYNTVSETITPIVSNLIATTTPVFAYYDSSYAGTSSPLAQPVNLTKVRFVQMSVTVLEQNTRTSTTTYTFTAGATIRSLKTNLGN